MRWVGVRGVDEAGRLRVAGGLAASFVLWTLLVAGGSLDSLDATMGHGLVDEPRVSTWTFITDLGDTLAVGTLVFLAALVALVRRDFVAAALAGAIPVGGWVLGRIVKVLVDRPRPDWALFAETGPAYPSNHTFVGWLLWVCVVWVLARNNPRRAQWAMLGVVPAVVVASSRVALGVHHVSDLVGSWLLGLTVLAALPWITARLDAWWLRLQGTSPQAPGVD